MEGFRLRKLCCREMWQSGGCWPLHLIRLDFNVASGRFETETDSALDHHGRWHGRRLLLERLHAGTRVYLRAREPQQAAQLLYRHVLRQVPSVRYARYDIRHGFSRCRLAPSYWSYCSTSV